MSASDEYGGTAMGDSYDDFTMDAIPTTQIPRFVRQKYDELKAIDVKVQEAIQKAEAATQSANAAARQKAGLFGKKKAIKSLQQAALDAASAIGANTEASSLLFQYQRDIMQITKALATVGMQSLAANRAAMKSLQDILHGAAATELSPSAREELMGVIRDLKSNEDWMQKVENTEKQGKDTRKRVSKLEKKYKVLVAVVVVVLLLTGAIAVTSGHLIQIPVQITYNQAILQTPTDGSGYQQAQADGAVSTVVKTDGAAPLETFPSGGQESASSTTADAQGTPSDEQVAEQAAEQEADSIHEEAAETDDTTIESNVVPPDKASGYTMETGAAGIQSFHTLVLTNDDVLYYIDGDVVIRGDGKKLNLSDDFRYKLGIDNKNYNFALRKDSAHLAYDRNNGKVYLFANGREGLSAMKAFDITDMASPKIVMARDAADVSFGYDENYEVSEADYDMAVPCNQLSNGAFLIPGREGSYIVDLTKGTVQRIYSTRGSTTIMAGDYDYSFERWPSELTLFPFPEGSPKTVSIEGEAPWVSCGTSDGIYYWDDDTKSLMMLDLDGWLHPIAESGNIKYADFLPAPWVSFMYVNGNGTCAIYDNPAKNIRILKHG